jgi:hypothetical protein
MLEPHLAGHLTDAVRILGAAGLAHWKSVPGTAQSRKLRLTCFAWATSPGISVGYCCSATRPSLIATVPMLPINKHAP